jgi:serralysin
MAKNPELVARKLLLGSVMKIKPAILLLSTLFPACMLGDAQEATPLDYDQFKARYVIATPDPDAEGGMLLAYDDDIPLESEDHVQELYAAYRASLASGEQISASLIDHRNGRDSIWPVGTRTNLTYCVANSFGTHKATVVNAIKQAAAEWTEASDGAVRFVYVPAQDAACTVKNTAVLFNARPINQPTSGLNAQSFAPFSPRAQRELLVNLPQFFGPHPTRSPLVGVMRHELGHILGLRHETNHPDIVAKYGAHCLEDMFFREVFGPVEDMKSVMTTAVCLGDDLYKVNPQRTISILDTIGIQLIY